MRLFRLQTAGLLLAFAGALCCAQAASPAKSVIQFERPIAKGAEFDCQIDASFSNAIAMKIPGAEKPVARIETASASLSGRMTVLEVNETGNPIKTRFQTLAFEGSLNNVKIDLSALQGKAFIAELNPPVCKFSLDGEGQAPLGKEAVKLLSIIFRPASKSSMADVLGTKSPVGPGDKWKPPCELLISTLAKRGFKLGEGDFAGEAVLKGRESFKGVDCWAIEERLESKNVPGLELRLNFSVLLPVDPAQGGALKISRNGSELVSKLLPAENPLSAGNSVEAIVKDSLEAVVLPLTMKSN